MNDAHNAVQRRICRDVAPRHDDGEPAVAFHWGLLAMSHNAISVEEYMRRSNVIGCRQR
jgi:hypothetical protein